MFENILMIVGIVLLGMLLLCVNGLFLAWSWATLLPASFPGWSFSNVVALGLIPSCFGAHAGTKSK